MRSSVPERTREDDNALKGTKKPSFSATHMTVGHRWTVVLLEKNRE